MDDLGFTVRLRRMFGEESSMNVFKKTFTRYNLWDDVKREWERDYGFLAGELPFCSGTRVKIKKPERFA